MKISKLSITESLLGESTSYQWIFLKIRAVMWKTCTCYNIIIKHIFIKSFWDASESDKFANGLNKLK